MSEVNETVQDVEMTPVKEDVKEPTLAEKVQGVENQVVQAMLEAAAPILEANGYQGFKDVRLVATQPDEEGNIQQSIRVIL
jgi:hypothetical protein